MKEDIEELRANVERTEMAGLTFIATRAACARAALDYIAQLEQTSRAQRTTITECNSAAAPAAGQAGLAKPVLNHQDIFEVWQGMPSGPEGWLKHFGYIQFAEAIEDKVLSLLAAPVAATEREGFWTWEQRAEAAEKFMKPFMDANGESLLGDYPAQPVVRLLASAILEWQKDAIKHAPEGSAEVAPVAADTEQATIDTPAFNALLDEFAYRASERRALGGDFGSAEAEDKAASALIAYIDSVKLAPLATPADAGAGLTDEQITEVVRRSVAAGETIWAGFKKDSEGRYTIPDLSPMEFKLARLIEREVLARMSTPGAQVTAEPVAYMYEWIGEPTGLRKTGEVIARTIVELGGNIDLHPHNWKRIGALYAAPVSTPAPLASAGRFDPDLLARAAVHAGFPNLSGFLMPPRTNGHITGELEAFAKYIAGQSPAPVTAEPARSIDTPEFLRLMEGYKAGEVAYRKVLAHIATHSAPADRDAIRNEALEEAAKACEGVQDKCQRRDGGKWPELRDDAESGAGQCAEAVRALKSMERAADAKGGV